MESNTNEQGLSRCPHCKKEFKQLSRHAPSCKKRPENETGTPSVKCDIDNYYVDYQPTGHKIVAEEERQGKDLANVMEKPREICSGCGETFIHLQKHKSRCRGIKLQTTGSEPPSFPEDCLESKMKSNQSSIPSLPTSATANCITKDSSKMDIISPDESTGTRHFNSAVTPITEKSKGKGNETCPNCGKSFKCVAKHIRSCKMQNAKIDANDINDCRITTNGKEDLDIQEYEKKKLPSVLSLTYNCEAEEERESKSGTNDGDNGSKGLGLADSEKQPQGKHLESIPLMEQGKTLTSCPYCGRGFIRLPMHMRACKKRPGNPHDPTSMSEAYTHSESSKQAQQNQIQAKCSRRKELISETQKSVKGLPFAVDGDYAEGNCDDKNDPRNTNYVREQETLHTPISTNPASLANMTYSEDPKAELDKLQADNEIDEVEICEAEKVVKKMEISFLQRLNDCSDFKWTIFRTGSYSDKTKIKSANEFDFIISIGIKCSVECLEESNTLGYCLVVPILEGNAPQDITLLMKDGYLDPGLIKDMAFKLFQKVITDVDFHKGRRIQRLYRDVGSPAFTITYKSGGGKEYEIDLVPAIHFDGWPHISAIKDWQPKWRQRHSLEELKKDYFAVAREHPNAKNLHQGELLWRLSFSKTEKMLWLSVDTNSSQPTCRKQILKFLKGILEDCKYNNTAAMPHLSSFHLRTFMLHQYDQRPDDNHWLVTNKRTCLHACINNLIETLSNKNMSNYYVRGHNVLEKLEDVEIQIFIKDLIKARTKF